MSEPTLFDRFHNTTLLEGDELLTHKFHAGKQNKVVLDFFRLHSYENYTPYEVWKALGINNILKSSVQRAITDLTTMTYLEKLDGKLRPDGTKKPLVQRPGQWKEKCFAWRVK